jgi:hypothetical protein
MKFGGVPVESPRGNWHRESRLWDTVHMAEKRTKADKAQRQADQLEKKARHPAPKKKKASARTSAKSLPGS